MSLFRDRHVLRAGGRLFVCSFGAVSANDKNEVVPEVTGQASPSGVLWRLGGHIAVYCQQRSFRVILGREAIPNPEKSYVHAATTAIVIDF